MHSGEAGRVRSALGVAPVHRGHEIKPVPLVGKEEQLGIFPAEVCIQFKASSTTPASGNRAQK